MKKIFKKAVSSFLILTLLLAMYVPTFAQETNAKDKHPKKQITKLDIKKKYNPLRGENKNLDENEERLVDIENIDYNDESVEIIRVTYYDEDGNLTREYEGTDALDHLYSTEKEEENFETELYLNELNEETLRAGDNRFEQRVVESFVSSNAQSKTIRKDPIDISLFDPTTFLYNAGLSYAKPVVSILNAAIS